MGFCIGLTGGIGSGKSTVAEMLREYGADIIDTDAISRALTKPGTAALSAISREWGSEYLLPDGSLDRAKLRARVFSDPRAKSRLEAILHPLIRQQVLMDLQHCVGPYAVVVVPLLVETGGYRDIVQRILVVDCEEQSQVTRAMQRSGLSAEQVLAIMANQATRATRLAVADDTIANDGSIDTLRRDVGALHQRYLELAAEAAKNRADP
jgi:dephospho-CoA kinase